MNVPAYLQRIKYIKSVQPNLNTLRGLHLANIQNIPFENLDIGLERQIQLREDVLWEKLIVHKRGGFCYELNGLFAWLLNQIGFEVTYLNARVFNRKGELVINFDHLALLVRISNQSTCWLADVGFGDSFNEPLRFDGAEQAQGLRAYRLDKTSNGYVVWQKNYDGTWERQYFFDLQPRSFPADYESACLYHQTSPESSFTRESIISMAMPDGRVSLEDGRLILTKNGKREEIAVANNEKYHSLLKEYFGVVI